MNKKEITCIVCPIGCKIRVKTDGKKFELLDGNKCKQGIEYARSEALDPRRLLTSSVLIQGGEWPLVSVKTTQPIPKKDIISVLTEMKKTKIVAPVIIGQIIIHNVAGTSADVVATKSIRKC